MVVTGGQRRGAAGDWRGGREWSSLTGGARWSVRLGGQRNSENGGRRRVGISRGRQSLIMRVSRRRWGRSVVGVRRSSRSREETEGRRSLIVGRRSVVMGVRRRCRLKRGTCSSRRLSRRKSWGGEDGGAVVSTGGTAGTGLLEVGVWGAMVRRSRRR